MAKQEVKEEGPGRKRGAPKGACEVSRDEIAEILKEHVKDPTQDDAWMSMETDAFIEHYQSFFSALLSLISEKNMNSKISVAPVKAAFRKIFECTVDYADLWASKCVHAWRKCRDTSKWVVDGSRLSHAPALKGIAIAMREQMISPSPSPSCSPPPVTRAKKEHARSVSGQDEVDAARSMWAPALVKEEEPVSKSLSGSGSSSCSGPSELERAMQVWGVTIKKESAAAIPAPTQVASHAPHPSSLNHEVGPLHSMCVPTHIHMRVSPHHMRGPLIACLAFASGGQDEDSGGRLQEHGDHQDGWGHRDQS